MSPSHAPVELARLRSRKLIFVAKIPDEVARRIDGYVTKYMDILQIDGERPKIKLRDDPRIDWVGRTDRHSDHSPTTIELQKGLFKNDRFLERVIAHEMVHHRNYLASTEDEKHGAAFREGAARINAIMGPDFVVEKISSPGSLSTKLLLALGLGGLGLLAAALLRRRQLSTAQRISIPTSQMTQPTRVNERGIYRKK